MSDSATNWPTVERLAHNDVVHLRTKARSYGDSWVRRGGVDSFMMLARKWDRIERMAAAYDGNIITALCEALQEREALRSAWAREAGHVSRDARAYVQWLEARQDDPAQDVADLRRYLLLVEEHVRRSVGAAVPEPALDHMGWDEAADAYQGHSPYDVPRPPQGGGKKPPPKLVEQLAAEEAARRMATARRLRHVPPDDDCGCKGKKARPVENKLPGELEGQVPE